MGQKVNMGKTIFTWIETDYDSYGLQIRRQETARSLRRKDKY